MSSPTPPPKYIYKILPPAPPPPSPLPPNLPLSPLDAGDGFIHLSTSSQILGTLQNFFKTESHVYILRIAYGTIEKWIKWEDTSGKQPDESGGSWDVESRRGLFPHIYGNAEDGGLQLGRQEVQVVGEWRRGENGWSKSEWPFDGDFPKQ